VNLSQNIILISGTLRMNNIILGELFILSIYGDNKVIGGQEHNGGVIK